MLLVLRDVCIADSMVDGVLRLLQLNERTPVYGQAAMHIRQPMHLS